MKLNVHRGLLGLGNFFAIVATLLDSKTALANLVFMLLLCLAHYPLERFIASLKPHAGLSLLGFGAILGLAEEALWYFDHLLEDKPQPGSRRANPVLRCCRGRPGRRGTDIAWISVALLGNLESEFTDTIKTKG